MDEGFPVHDGLCPVLALPVLAWPVLAWPEPAAASSGQFERGTIWPLRPALSRGVPA